MALVDVTSEIAGTVWKIEAKVGDQLQEDDPILVLESMKMEIPVTAPKNGSVAEILVSEEDIVNEDQVIARLEV